MLSTPQTSSIVQDGKRIITTVYPDNSECIEEIDMKTQEVLVRKHRHKNALGAWKPWEYEIGEPIPIHSDTFLTENANNPFLYRKDTPTHFVWRIRNAIWPKHVYDVKVVQEQIIVKTTNKKFSCFDSDIDIINKFRFLI